MGRAQVTKDENVYPSFEYSVDQNRPDSDVRGAFGKFLAWSFISVTDLQALSCLICLIMFAYLGHTRYK